MLTPNEAAATAPIQKRHEKHRPEDVKLFLDSERPKVELRIFRRIRREIATLSELKQIRNEGHTGRGALAEQGKTIGQEHEPADQIGDGQHHDERRKYSPDPAGIEFKRRESSRLGLGENDTG